MASDAIPPSFNSTISKLRAEDEKLSRQMQYLVPVKIAENQYAPSVYTHMKEPAMWDKVNYAHILTGKPVQPTVSITEEDISLMKDKAWKATHWDFDNWVGQYFRPNENPANKKLLQEIYPEWFENQKEVINNWHDFKRRVETVKIMGPQNKEDLFLFYRLGYPTGTQQGTNEDISTFLRTPPPFGAINTFGDPRANFQRGIFNTSRKTMLNKAMYGNPHSLMGPTLQNIATLPATLPPGVGAYTSYPQFSAP